MSLRDSEPDSEESRAQAAHVQRPPSASTDNRRGFASDIVSAITSLIVGIAWPVATVIIVYYLTQHGNTFVSDFQALMKGNKQVEISAGMSGVHLVAIAEEVQKGLSQQASAQAGGNAPQGAEATAIQQAAAQAASQLSSPASDRAKVLWVDDHPQNNLGLAYAFQALGIIVVCVDSNEVIDDAFATAGNFDVVITDMYRDAAGYRNAQPEGGLETIKIINGRHASVPVIVYADGYAVSHANEPLQTPVIEITNDPRLVFMRVTEIARKKS